MLKRLCVISDRYPSNGYPVYTFVGELVKAISSKGIECVVITSCNDTKIKYEEQIDNKGNIIRIYRVFFPSLGKKKIGHKALTYYFRDYIFKRTFFKRVKYADAFYCHFWNVGIPAAFIDTEIPIFVASGESRVWVQDLYDRKIIDKAKKNIKGVICVSSKNKEESIQNKLITDDKTIIIPNAIDNKIFRKIDKEKCRKKLSINASDFVIVFVGALIDRKGPLRVAEAVKRVPDVKSIYIGKGDQQPKGDGILFCGQLPHDEIPVYLNAADVFVLPTKQEGCCNAIVEAMACGLPIISTDRRFNDDILNENNSIRIDCEDIDQIAEAIRKIKESTELRKSMSNESLRIAANLTIDKRAEKIIDFIEESI